VTADQQELERSIEAARAAGDTTRLRSLQDSYRSSGFATTRVRVDGISIHERTSSVTSTMRSAGTLLPLVVRLTSGARQMLDELDLGDREVGSWLVGTITESEIVIQQLRGDTVGDRTSVTLDGERAAELDSSLGASSGWRICGVVHSHPSGDARLSMRDMEISARHAAGLKQPVADLLVTPALWRQDSDPWARPDLSAWITGPDGVTRSAPLLLEERKWD